MIPASEVLGGFAYKKVKHKYMLSGQDSLSMTVYSYFHVLLAHQYYNHPTQSTDQSPKAPDTHPNPNPAVHPLRPPSSPVFMRPTWGGKLRVPRTARGGVQAPV